MKEKILAALKQKYANLGLSNDVFEGVASAVANFTTDETLESFIAGAEGMLKQYQSIGDRARTERDTAKREVDELKAKLAKLEGGDPNKDKSEDANKDIASIIEAAIAKATAPLTDKITALESARSLETAVNSAHDTFFSNDYVKKYKDEAADAWERATEMNTALGGKMTADELKEKALGYFNKSVARIGVDTSKPFEAQERNDDEGTIDWAAEKARKEAQGLIKKTE